MLSEPSEFLGPFVLLTESQVSEENSQFYNYRLRVLAYAWTLVIFPQFGHDVKRQYTSDLNLFLPPLSLG